MNLINAPLVRDTVRSLKFKIVILHEKFEFYQLFDMNCKLLLI